MWERPLVAKFLIGFDTKDQKPKLRGRLSLGGLPSTTLAHPCAAEAAPTGARAYGLLTRVRAAGRAPFYNGMGFMLQPTRF
jgi:hypothetical protein